MKLHSPREVCGILGIHRNTLDIWERTGKIKAIRTQGNHRRYDLSEFELPKQKSTVCYCRVSSTKQKDDLARQVEFMREKFPEGEVIKDVGSGINFKRHGLKSILERAMRGEQLKVVVAHKDRLARFGADIIEFVLKQNGGELLVLDKVVHSPEQELTQDLLTILHVFSCRMHGLRKYRDKIKEDTSLSEKQPEGRN